MRRGWVGLLGLGVVGLLAGCGSYDRHGVSAARAHEIEAAAVRLRFSPAPELAARILALDPEHVTGQDVREVLAGAPAPRVINIHGGVYYVRDRMVSFSEFLMGMGYPGRSLTNPGDGSYTFSCYESSKKIAGAIAWYYEREGLRPMLVGHSQGGFQVVKVLRRLAGLSAARLQVWNPLTWEEEERTEFLDPISGRTRPVVGLTLPYANSVAAGGVTRFLPNQWDMCGHLRSVPDSVEDFTGFFKGKDLYGGDWLGYGPANEFKSMGQAVVRNVRLPTAYKHGWIPDTRHLLKSRRIMDWINAYHPPDKLYDEPRLEAQFDADSRSVLWAADTWFSLKKHWVLELQRWVRSQPPLPHAP
jgi:hypothetical protein